MKKIEKIHNAQKQYRFIPLSAGVVASILFALNPNETVIASEEYVDNDIVEFEALHEEVYSFLSELENQDDSGEVEEADAELTEEKDSISPLVSKYDEMTAIKNILLNAISHAENNNYAAELSAADLTIPELEEILNQLVLNAVNEEAADLEKSEEFEEPEVDLVAEEVTDEIEEVEEIEEPVVATPAQTPSTASVQVTTASNADELKTIVHTVKAGETLNKIASRYNVTVNHIIAINNISNPNLIRVGQKLTINSQQAENPGNLEEISGKLTNSEFIEVVGKSAQQVAKDHNLYASVMIAQAALESGYGGSSLSAAPNHNLFGIKGSYKGDSVTMRTREYYNGWVYVDAAFKKYPSFTESLLDNAGLLRNGLSWDRNFYSGTWLENTTSYQDATSWLQGRYATDPTYASKLNSIIARYNLTRFDLTNDTGDIEAPPVKEEQEVNPSTGQEESINGGNYTVKRGDTLSHIARAHNTTVANLKRLNSLKSDLIYVGQTLKVGEAASQPTPAPVPSKPSQVTYTIKRGDTLSHIARAHNTTVANLKQLNNLKSDLIYVGQSLKVSSSSATTGTQKPKPSVPNNQQTYRINRGDTLSHIAVRFNTTVNNLKAKNNLKSDLIFVGQTIKV